MRTLLRSGAKKTTPMEALDDMTGVRILIAGANVHVGIIGGTDEIYNTSVNIATISGNRRY